MLFAIKKVFYLVLVMPDVHDFYCDARKMRSFWLWTKEGQGKMGVRAISQNLQRW